MVIACLEGNYNCGIFRFGLPLFLPLSWHCCIASFFVFFSFLVSFKPFPWLGSLRQSDIPFNWLEKTLQKKSVSLAHVFFAELCKKHEPILEGFLTIRLRLSLY